MRISEERMQNAQKKTFNARLLQNVYTYDIEDKRL